MAGRSTPGSRARIARLALAPALVASLLLAACGSDPPRTGSSAGEAWAPGPCDWPMLGQGLTHTFAASCPSAITPESVGDLQQAWFFNTDDVVTASPAVVDGTAYVGDWSGRFYALDAETGQPRWTFQADTDPQVYAGQIVSSAAVADAGGAPTVFFGSGRTLHALDAADGHERWSYAVGTDDPQDFTEIESSPAVVDGTVLFGIDVHNQPGHRGGLVALDAATGQLRWQYDAEAGAPKGCGDVWGSPSVDLDRRLVFFGTANCPASPDGWGPDTEAIIAVGLDDGQRRWSYQPHPPNNDDLDFAGAPNLFRAGDRDLVGLGNKDGTYYTVDRDTGELVWKSAATGPGLDEHGSNFSTGGFIAPTAADDGIIAGGTAVGPAPYLHALDATDGHVLWQSPAVQATYAPSAVVNGLLFNGGNDFTLRAFDLRTGDVRWQHEMKGVVAGGPVVVGDSVYAVAGIREPGLQAKSENSGVYRFSLPAAVGAADGSTTTASEPPTTAARAGGLALEPTTQACVDQPCDLFQAGITLRPPPAGLQPTATLEVTSDPFRITIHATGLGEPSQWLQAGSPAAQAGATVFGLFISESDDNPVGGVLCVLDSTGTCTTDSLPRLTSYNRISLLALERPDSVPTVSDGPPRLIVTTSFDPPLTPVGAPPR